MELKHLTAFVFLAQSLNFRQTAKQLGISQPALSKRIKYLEADLGIQLFERKGSHINLTCQANMILPGARKVIRECDRFDELMTVVKNKKTSSLNIGFGISGILFVPKLILDFKRENRNIEINLTDMSSLQQYSHVENGQLDIGFVNTVDDSDINFLPVYTEHLAVAVSNEYKDILFDENDNLIIENLQLVPYCRLKESRGPSLFGRISRFLNANNTELTPFCESSNIQTLLAHIVAGSGFTFVPQSAAAIMPGDNHIIPIKGRYTQWTVGMIWTDLDERNDSKIAFINYAKKRFNEMNKDGNDILKSCIE